MVDGSLWYWYTLLQMIVHGQEIQDSFNESLGEMIANVPKWDHRVLMGDLNARVGRDVETWGEVIGRHGEETKMITVKGC